MGTKIDVDKLIDVLKEVKSMHENVLQDFYQDEDSEYAYSDLILYERDLVLVEDRTKVYKIEEAKGKKVPQDLLAKYKIERVI